MKDFAYYLDKTQEVGIADLVTETLVYAQGLPHAHPGEVVLFESGQIGYVLSLSENAAEILLLSAENVLAGTRITRTGGELKIQPNETYLGKSIFLADLNNDLFVFDGETKDGQEGRPIDNIPIVFSERRKVDEPLETGVTIVDLAIPLARGQREFIVGDRKTGKSNFLLQTFRTQAKKGCICIYGAIAKSHLEVRKITDFFREQNFVDQTVLVCSYSSYRSGLIFLTPYIAMTMAEYFRDQGKEVILILDDLTVHARYYREIMLLAKRFPGRNSYPGDVFYAHARLLERAGKFAKGSISCLPVGQSVLGDLSGYIQTNLMSITDGHVFFDSDIFDQGRRPAINPFLSVTRVGEQTQTQLVREIGRHLRGFLVHFEQLKQFRHFQTELGEKIQETFEMGDRILSFLDQTPDIVIPLSINIVMYAGLWADFWRSTPVHQMKKEMLEILKIYDNNQTFREQVEAIVKKSLSFEQLLEEVKTQQNSIMEYATGQGAVPPVVAPTPPVVPVAIEKPKTKQSTPKK